MANPYKNVVALVMRNIMEDKEMTLFGEGRMLRAFSYVDDVVDVLVDALNDKWKNQTVNLGSSMETEIIDLVKLIEQISGKQLNKKMLPARPQEIFHFLASHKKLNNMYNYHETPLEEGLRTTWEFLNLPEIIKEENEIGSL
jgi:UDP-glucose 4-epimerase